MYTYIEDKIFKKLLLFSIIFHNDIPADYITNNNGKNV
jgi:hypothetical protein